MANSLVPPARLRLLQDPGTGRGRVGRALQGWIAPPAGPGALTVSCRRIPVTAGIEVLVDEQHPLLRMGVEPAAIAEALRRAVAHLLPASASPDHSDEGS